ncbi:hypothetical protein MTR67_035097 [Solanum verrucosum]|uniref:Secreted protein n=1 Tax=Solanum verrucosum TaxID=315347 RepID=A0AAF0U9C6_SOLVR|nr:hypothetical protein MTR67_035097 [Solanum verrucosum]
MVVCCFFIGCVGEGLLECCFPMGFWGGVPVEKRRVTVAKNVLQRVTWRSRSGSPIHSPICPLVNSIAFVPWSLAFSRAWHTGTLGGQVAIR